MRSIPLPVAGPRLLLVGIICSLIFFSCSNKLNDDSTALASDSAVVVHGPYRVVRLPLRKGAVRMGNPVQITKGPSGLIYVANQTGEIFTLHDTNDDGLEDSTALYCDVRKFSLRSPAGLTSKGDTLFVGTAQQIRAFRDQDGDGVADTSWIFFDKIPQSEHPYEWTSGLCFGPDGWMYFALTTDSFNAAPSPDPEHMRGAIVRVSPDGRSYEIEATGIRSVPGMAFHSSGDLFFTDNEGGGNPTEELNRVMKGKFYGHNKKKYGENLEVTGPEFSLSAEVAPSSIEFNWSGNDFGGSQGNLFVSYYGPGERWERGAIGRVVVNKDEEGKYQFTEYTLADVPKVSDIAFGSNGALYIASHGKADYWYNAVLKEEGAIFRMTHEPSINKPVNYVRAKPEKLFEKNAVEMGKQLFAETGCLGCHQVDGTTDLLGPNLKGVASRLSREELLEEIQYPSKIVKSGMSGTRITRKSGEMLYGRVVTSSEQLVSMMLVGNSIIEIPRTDIVTVEPQEKSLMFEGMTRSMKPEQLNALLDYLQSI